MDQSKADIHEDNFNPGDPEAKAEWYDPYGFQSHNTAERYIHWLENELRIRSRKVVSLQGKIDG